MVIGGKFAARFHFNLNSRHFMQKLKQRVIGYRATGEKKGDKSEVLV